MAEERSLKLEVEQREAESLRTKGQWGGFEPRLTHGQVLPVIFILSSSTVGVA